ncbi:MAG: hypothetical protein OXI87_02740 [Albidovulum sp.]|nr:hypothetical protein [Albidovulum sp.]MDE0532381.1 hypothetical protein [Albidovulum sp.]
MVTIVLNNGCWGAEMPISEVIWENATYVLKSQVYHSTSWLSSTARSGIAPRQTFNWLRQFRQFLKRTNPLSWT